MDELHTTLARLREAWHAGKPDRAQRLDDLGRLRAALAARLDDMAAAISADFGHRSVHESLLADGMAVLAEIDRLRRELPRWMRPRRVGAGWRLWPARAEVRHVPVGVVGVISPWNYPVNLALVPLATAIAAGNHVYLKPSEFTPRTSGFLEELLREVFPADRVAVAQGDGQRCSRHIPDQREDHERDQQQRDGADQQSPDEVGEHNVDDVGLHRGERNRDRKKGYGCAWTGFQRLEKPGP